MVLLLPWFDEASNDIEAVFVIKFQIKSLAKLQGFETFIS